VSEHDIAVIGAGPSGLAAAYRLQEAGHQVRVFDRRDRPGGKMQTSYRDGFVIDEGPSIMPSRYTHILRLARDAGMGDDVVPGGSIFGFAGPRGMSYLDAEHLIRSGLKFDLFGTKPKYAHHLAEQLDVHLGCEVHSVEQTDTGARVAWTDPAGGGHEESFDGCVLASDAKTMARTYSTLDPARAQFVDRLTYTTHVNVCAALSRAPHVPAFAINVPQSVHPGLIVIVQDHLKLPSHAPAGKGLLSLFTSTGWSRALRDKDDDVIIKEVLEATDLVLPGASGDLEFASVHRWNPMLMQSYPGYYRGLRQFVALCRQYDRYVQLAGDYFCQGSVNAATASGERAARDLHAVLTGTRSER
jgi:protoporphyrinogen oxidase